MDEGDGKGVGLHTAHTTVFTAAKKAVLRGGEVEVAVIVHTPFHLGHI